MLTSSGRCLRASVVVISWTSYGSGIAFSLMFLVYVMYVAFMVVAFMVVVRQDPLDPPRQRARAPRCSHRYPGCLPFPDIAGAADASPIAGVAVRSLSCGSAWSV